MDYNAPSLKSRLLSNSISEANNSEIHMLKYSYDPSFNGIEEERKCTDVCMLAFFLIFISGMIGAALHCLTSSKVDFLYLPTDYRGLICGYNNVMLHVNNSMELPDLSNKPALFWWRPGPKMEVRSSCVEACPRNGLFSNTYANSNAPVKYFEKDQPCDVITVDGKKLIINATVEDYLYGPEVPKRFLCPYASDEMFLRCIPSQKAFADMTSGEIGGNLSFIIGNDARLNNSIMELQHSYMYVLVFSAVSVFGIVMWLLSLRCSATFFVSITVGLTFVMLYGFTLVLYLQSTSTVNYMPEVVVDKVSQESYRKVFWVSLVFDIVLTLIVVFLYKRIRFATSIIKVVSEVLADVPTLFIFPAIPYILMIIWWVICCAIFVVIAGCVKMESVTEEGVMSVKYHYASDTKFIFWYELFGMLWGTAFIKALGQMTVAGVYSKHFFSREPKRQNMGRAPVFSSFIRALRYHTGSIAFGSLLVPILSIIRSLLKFLQDRTKNSKNTFVAFIVKCLACFCWCFEKFVKYISRNSYILTAIHGYSFFEGCTKSFGLLARNLARASVMNWIGDFLIFLGKIMVSTLMAFFALLAMNHDIGLSYTTFPTVIVFFLSYIMCSIFTTTVEMGIDTSFLCALEDEERNDGTPGRERYASQDLLNSMNPTSYK